MIVNRSALPKITVRSNRLVDAAFEADTIPDKARLS